MIIEVNCNQLSYNLRAELFDSSRQKLDQKYEKILEKSIKDFLSNDKFLEKEQLRLEKEDRKKEISVDTEQYRQELAEMIEDYSPGKYSVSKPGDDSKIELLDTPTYFKIAMQKNDIDVSIGKKCSLKLEANITDKSFINGEYYIECDSDCRYKFNFQIPKLSKGVAIVVLSFNDVSIRDKIPIKFLLKSKIQSISLETDTKYINIVEEKNSEDIDLLDNPTYFKIKNSKNDINVIINKKCNLTLESNITDKSFTTNKCYIQFDKRIDGVDHQIPTLKKGRGVVTLSFPEAKIGNKFSIKFFLKSGNHAIKLETDKKNIHIIKKPIEKKRISIDAPYPIEVYRNGSNKEKYSSFGWEKDERISKVERGNKIDIYVNMSHSKFEEFLYKINIKQNKIDTIKKDYLLNICFASFLQDEGSVFKDMADHEKIEEVKDSSLAITAQTLFRYLKKKN